MVRLRRSDATGKGYTRRRSGKGWTYLDSDGNRVTDKVLRARMDHLGIPPAWTDVWIAPYENGHVQATGMDSAGRRQYIYHPTWREQKDRIKFDRSLQLAESLPPRDARSPCTSARTASRASARWPPASGCSTRAASASAASATRSRTAATACRRCCARTSPCTGTPCTSSSRRRAARSG